MPNTPALVGEGMAGLFAAKNTSENDRTFAQDLLSAVGKTLWVASEDHMHAVTAASGSSPAYFFQFLEAMQQGLIEMGLSAENARELVQQAMLGSAKMVVENPQVDLATLRQNVTSKGGTTAAALNVFNQRQFNDIVQQAIQACVARSKWKPYSNVCSSFYLACLKLFRLLLRVWRIHAIFPCLVEISTLRRGVDWHGVGKCLCVPFCRRFVFLRFD